MTSCVTERFSKLEIQRVLDLAGTGSGNRLPKSAYRVKPEPKTGLIWETFAYSAAVSQGGKQKLRTKRRKPEVFLLQIGRSDGIRTPRLLLPGHNEKAKSDERVRRNQITNATDSSSERAVTCQESSDAAPCAYQNKEHQSDQDLFPGTGTDVERGEHRQVVTTIRKRNASDRKNLCCAGALSRHTLLFFVHRPTQKLVKADRNGHDAERSNQHVRQMRGGSCSQQAEPDHCRDTQVLA